MRTIHRDCVVGFIISKDKKLLMGKKDPSKGGVYPDSWHLPGGGIETGENKQKALKREMLEETGIDISKANVSLLDDRGTGKTKKQLQNPDEIVMCDMKFYTYSIAFDQPAAAIHTQHGDDFVLIEWFDLNAMPAADLTPPSIRLFKRLDIL